MVVAVMASIAITAVIAMTATTVAVLVVKSALKIAGAFP